MNSRDESGTNWGQAAASQSPRRLGDLDRTLRVIGLLLGAALIGVVLAAIAHYWFFVGTFAWVNLVLWAIIAIAVGAAARTWAMTISVSAIIGFCIVLVYSLLGYHATAPLPTVEPAFAVLSIVGALGMAVASATGHQLGQLGKGGRGHHDKHAAN